MAPIFEDGNNKKDRPREDDLFDRSSQGNPNYFPILVQGDAVDGIVAN